MVMKSVDNDWRLPVATAEQNNHNLQMDMAHARSGAERHVARRKSKVSPEESSEELAIARPRRTRGHQLVLKACDQRLQDKYKITICGSCHNKRWDMRNPRKLRNPVTFLKPACARKEKPNYI